MNSAPIRESLRQVRLAPSAKESAKTSASQRAAQNGTSALSQSDSAKQSTDHKIARKQSIALHRRALMFIMDSAVTEVTAPSYLLTTDPRKLTRLRYVTMTIEQLYARNDRIAPLNTSAR